MLQCLGLRQVQKLCLYFSLLNLYFCKLQCAGCSLAVYSIWKRQCSSKKILYLLKIQEYNQGKDLANQSNQSINTMLSLYFGISIKISSTVILTPALQTEIITSNMQYFF